MSHKRRGLPQPQPSVPGVGAASTCTVENGDGSPNLTGSGRAFEQLARAPFPLRAILDAVEVRPLLGHRQSRALAVRLKLDGRERHRQLPFPTNMS